MDGAVIGLIGVAIGGAISISSTLLGERGQDRREQRAQRREERQALRMVHQELLTIQYELDAAIENKRWWNRTDLKFATPAWERFGHAVAASEIDENSWTWVAHAYSEIFDLNETVHRNKINATNAGTYSLVFDDNAEQLASMTRNSVEQGVEFLDAFMSGGPSPATAPPEESNSSLRTGAPQRERSGASG
jgi:hypothetical protein